MKITDITTKVMNVSRFSNWIFVFVQTDEGITGLGECTLDGYEERIIKSIENIKSWLIGKDPIEQNLLHSFNPSNMMYAAIKSGLDIALWDIRGKYFNKPIYALLGGAVRKELEVYATFNRALKTRSIEEFADTAKRIVEVGYRGLKCAPFDGYMSKNYLSDKSFIDRGVDRINVIRKAIGKDINLHVDNHWRFDYHTSIRVANRIQEYDIYWFEAPISEKNPVEMSRLKSNIPMPMAGCEMQINIDEIRDLLINDTLDVYMPDIKYIGGISGFIKAANIIDSFGKLVSPHNMTGPVSFAASMHVSAVINNFLVLESHIPESEWSEKVSDLSKNISDGKMTVSQKPGLGIELNMDILDSRPYQKPEFLRNNMLGV